MAITASDIGFYYSGGSGNSTPGASLGGSISSTEITLITNGIFDDVTGEEAASGVTYQHRAIFVKNNHPTLTWQTVRYYIYSHTSGYDAIYTMPEASKGLTGKTSITIETDNPTGGGFGQPSVGSPTPLGNLAPLEGWMIWIRRVIPAGCAAVNNNSFTIRFIGDTQA